MAAKNKKLKQYRVALRGGTPDRLVTADDVAFNTLGVLFSRDEQVVKFVPLDILAHIEIHKDEFSPTNI